MSRVQPLHARLARDRGGVPLPELDQRRLVPPRGPRADSWYGSNGTDLPRILSTLNFTDKLSETPQSRGRKGELGKTGTKNSTKDDPPAAVGTPTFTSAVQEIVIGSDDRQQITDTQATPYAWICDLLITDAMGREWIGTGWLASPRLVVTAGHCVYLTNQAGWARSITVAPSRDGTDTPYTFDAIELHSVSGWVNAGQPEYDYGAMILPAEAEYKLGHFGFGSFADWELDGELVNVVGYPSDKPEGTMWGSVRALDASLPDVLIYDVDTFGGMSGSPVIRWDETDYIVVGIHNYGDILGNRATRITTPVFRNILTWASRASSL